MYTIQAAETSDIVFGSSAVLQGETVTAMCHQSHPPCSNSPQYATYIDGMKCGQITHIADRLKPVRFAASFAKKREKSWQVNSSTRTPAEATDIPFGVSAAPLEIPLRVHRPGYEIQKADYLSGGVEMQSSSCSKEHRTRPPILATIICDDALRGRYPAESATGPPRSVQCGSKQIPTGTRGRDTPTKTGSRNVPTLQLLKL